MEPDARSVALTDFPALAARLHPRDDPEFWSCILATVLSEIDARWALEPTCARRICVGLFKVLEWLRPHQRRWILGGGFAAPDTYRNHADQQGRWQVWLCREQGDVRWVEAGGAEPRVRKRREFAVRIAVPGRSKLHDQAAVAASWRPHAPWRHDDGEPICGVWYGFRWVRGGPGWQFVTCEELTGHST